MNATTIEDGLRHGVVVASNPPEDLTFEQWLATMRELCTMRRNADWMAGDWLNIGIARFPEQLGMSFLGEELGISPKRLTVVMETAKNFPPAVRDESMTVEAHALVAELPVSDRMEILTAAKSSRWHEDEIRKAVITRKVDLHMFEMIAPADLENHYWMSLQHAWNRAPQSVKDNFLISVMDAARGEIDD